MLDELHAELCFAEALLLKALLTFIEDETLVSFIKAGIKIRTCYNSYKYVSRLKLFFLVEILNIYRVGYGCNCLENVTSYSTRAHGLKTKSHTKSISKVEYAWVSELLIWYL